MFKTIIRAIYTVFISLVLISIILAGWSSYVFVFQPSKTTEVTKVIGDIYSSQKSVFFDIIELSKILINDKNDNLDYDNTLLKKESPSVFKNDSQLDEQLTIQDSGENPLGIVIEESLPQVTDEPLPDVSYESSVNEEKVTLEKKIEMEMEMEMGMEMDS